MGTFARPCRPEILGLALIAMASWPGSSAGRPTAEGPGFAESAGMVLVPIEPGEFWMGVRDDEKPGSDAQRPRHRVRITRPFLMSAHEVTIGQFRRFVEATGYRTEAERDGRGGIGWDAFLGINVGPDPRFTWNHTGFPHDDDHPVVNVSWDDAVAFCDWLGREDGRTFHLPTEAEWEYACRAGTETVYGFGDDPADLIRYGNFADRSYEVLRRGDPRKAPDDGFAFTAPVGRFLPNAWGLYDMHGNVAEWCLDYYARGYGDAAPRDDPAGPAEGKDRVLRNEGWNGSPRLCYAAARFRNPASGRSHSTGFRVVAVPAEASPE